MSTLGGDPEMTTVSEAGMYEDEKSNQLRVVRR